MIRNAREAIDYLLWCASMYCDGDEEMDTIRLAYAVMRAMEN
jgi:hypothetical protein